MIANPKCISCLTGKQETKLNRIFDENKKARYREQVRTFLDRHAASSCAPWLAWQLDLLFSDFFGISEDFTEIKKIYNRYLLNIEADLEARIRSAKDSLRECIQYVCAGNYIDFGAMQKVDDSLLESLLEKAGQKQVDEREYQLFVQDLAKAQTLVYLTDNCGEIVLDKLFIRLIKERFPSLRITVVVRGQNTLNDATMEDAAETGLSDTVTCIGNGNGAPGTVPVLLSSEAKNALDTADVIISKGQGNFESLYGEGYCPYYLFLCKCDLFAARFGLSLYSGVFAREDRLALVPDHQPKQ